MSGAVSDAVYDNGLPGFTIGDATAANQTTILAAIPSAATVAAAVWNYLTSAMTTAGSIGKKLADWVVGTINATNTTGVFPASTLTNAPTGSTYSLQASTVAVGALSDTSIVAYQNTVLGPYAFTVSGQAAKSHAFIVYRTTSTTPVFTLTTAAADITATTATITVQDHAGDDHTTTPGVYRYVLRNTTDDIDLFRGTLTIVEEPETP